MITEERLKELIKQGATIYDIFKGDIYLIDLTMAKYYDVPKYIEYKNDYYNCNLTRSINDLFETKEEAEEYLEFGNIIRPERLNLPTWKEFVKLEENYDYGYNTIKSFDDVKFGYVNPYNDKSTCLFIEKSGKTIYLTNMVTKETYLEARRLCKKLFLGEE